MRMEGSAILAGGPRQADEQQLSSFQPTRFFTVAASALPALSTALRVMFVLTVVILSGAGLNCDGGNA